MQFALNQATVPHLSFVEFLDLAARLGCVGVEPRNDMARPLFDGLNAVDAGALARAKGLRIVGLSQVYPFNDWSDGRKSEIVELAKLARACGSPSVSLIPRVDGEDMDEAKQADILAGILDELAPIFRGLGVVGAIEPIGFSTSSIATKQVVVDQIGQQNVSDCFGIVHDTFQHCIAHDPLIAARYTSLVHISGVSDPTIALDEEQDAHRGLVEAGDRLDNVGQIKALIAGGYRGVFSFEITEKRVHALPDLEQKLGQSMALVRALVG